MKPLGSLAIPDISTLPRPELPKLYQSAQYALEKCSRIDECQDWSSKAKAIASYAKQANDKELHNLATRIQARAIRRCGQLLKEVDPAKGANQNFSPGSGTKVSTRKEMATNAGMSKRQKDTAIQVANVPQETFDSAVESEAPPTVTQLAEAGTKANPKPLVDIGDIPPEDYARATRAQGLLKNLAAFCQDNEPQRIASAFQHHEIPGMRKCAAIGGAWLNVFLTSLKGAPL